MVARVTSVRFEHLTEVALGVGHPAPRLSWQVSADQDWAQTEYEVELDGRTTIRVQGPDQVLVPWPFEPLTSRGRAAVRVRVADGDRWSDWSAPATVEAGLLTPADWTARFISPRSIGGLDMPAPVLTRTVTLRPGIVSARLYATAHGVYTVTLNGERVGDDVLAPGWTSYHHRLRYQTYDVTAGLREGANTLEVLLGNGWYRGKLGWWGQRGLYGDRLAMLAQLEVTYEDGSAEVVGTGEGWSARESGVLENDLYDGQRTDLRPRPPGHDPVDVLEEDLGRLVAPDGPPVRVTQVVPAVSAWPSPSGGVLVDFGQNLVGWVRLRVRDTVAGSEITVRHAEVLENGELCVRGLRGARATDTYVLDTAGEAVLEPSLTFHGFRYAEITGTSLRAEDVEAVVVGSDLPRTGWFSCSDPHLSRFHDNVVWGARGNFLDVPTDCPQRDERLGWTGDIQVFAPTGSFLFDTAGFLTSWLADLAADQGADGSVPFVIPDMLSVLDPAETPWGASPAAAAWGDAAAVVPWVLYERYGDVLILERQFASMRAWVDKVASMTDDGVRRGGFQFGDWLDPSAPPDDPFAAKTDPDLIATAYLARSAAIVADTARVLDRPADAERYAALAAGTRDAFARAFATGAGQLSSDSQTAYALALAWDLLTDVEQREGAGRRLADLVQADGFRIGTGFVGTPVIADALTACGRADLAHRLLLERGCPSWLYPVTMGATTVWERWDAVLPDGSINQDKMISFNHYALGAVADWMHRVVAGLAPAAPGYREITVRPLPPSSLTHASARHQTPYGEASVAWRRSDGRFELDVVIPVGTRATVWIPGAPEAATVGHGRHSWSTQDPWN